MTEFLNQQLDHFDKVSPPSTKGWSPNNPYHFHILIDFKPMVEEEKAYVIRYKGCTIRVSKTSCREVDWEGGRMYVHRQTFRDLHNRAKSARIKQLRESI